jgi:hypothetical protein
MWFIQKKITFFQNSKEFKEKTLGRGPTGEEGAEGIYKKVPFVIQVLMRMDKIQNIWGMISWGKWSAKILQASFVQFQNPI